MSRITRILLFPIVISKWMLPEFSFPTANQGERSFGNENVRTQVSVQSARSSAPTIRPPCSSQKQLWYILTKLCYIFKIVVRKPSQWSRVVTNFLFPPECLVLLSVGSGVDKVVTVLNLGSMLARCHMWFVGVCCCSPRFSGFPLQNPHSPNSKGPHENHLRLT